MMPAVLGAGGLFALLAFAMSSGDGGEETGGAEADDPELLRYAMDGTVRSRLSPHFTWDEALKTSHNGGVNVVSDDTKLRFQVLVDRVLEPLRVALGRPVRISSGMRSKAVNDAAGGKSTSRHLSGEAADIQVSGVSPEALAATIRKLKLPVDQVIWYPRDSTSGGWTHVQIRIAEGNRGEYRVNYASDPDEYPFKAPNAALAVV